jgi:NADH-quinone oxidoreductase subunit M
MIALWILIITALGGLLAWLVSKWSKSACRFVTLIALIINFIILVVFWVNNYSRFFSESGAGWLTDLEWDWIAGFGISFHLAMDGLSLLLLLLTFFLGIASVAVSWNQIQNRVGFFHFNLMLILAGITGVFTAVDLFLFYFFWELMLVPMYFFISIWGHENRHYAAFKFFIFTQAGGLLMLLSILALYFIHAKNTGIYTFDYTQLLGTSMTKSVSIWIMLGFFIAFAVKLPMVPIHTWLADAHTEAPTAGSVILAGLLLKTGAYGMIRFLLPLFGEACAAIGPVVRILAVVGILYGAVLAFAQKDAKRLVAYSSISHLGFVLLGIFAGNMMALQGAVIIMLAHGLSTGGLFILVGAIDERIHTRDMNSMGGLWSAMPRMGGVGMFLAMASLGLPGLANFVGEFLVLCGAFGMYPTITVIAALGFIVATIYSLWLIHRVFHGPNKNNISAPDMNLREMAVSAAIIAGIVWIGFFPQTVLNTVKPAIDTVLRQSVLNYQAVESPELSQTKVSE